MTYSDFNAAIGVRHFHEKRINRFLRKRPLRDETGADLVRSLKLHDACTDFLGDGLFVDLPHDLSALVKMYGYQRQV